jgi:hypothetical protein
MQILFRATAPIPELAARAGEYLLVETDARPDVAICVMHEHDAREAATVLANMDRLDLMSKQSPAVVLAQLKALGKAGAS